jgi:hypothetical protein
MSSRHISLLDKMEEVDKELQADEDAGESQSLSSGDELLLDDDDDEEDDDGDGDEEEEDDGEEDEDAVVNDEDEVLQMILNEDLAAEVRLLGDGELEEILDESLSELGYGYTNPMPHSDNIVSNSNNAVTLDDSYMDDSEVWDTPTPLEYSSSLNMSTGMPSNRFQASPGSRNYNVFQGSTSLPSYLSPEDSKRRASQRSDNEVGIAAPPLVEGSGGVDEEADYGYGEQEHTTGDQSGEDKRKGRSSIRESQSSGGGSGSNSRLSRISVIRASRPSIAGTEEDSSSVGSGFRPFGRFSAMVGSRARGGSSRGGSSFQSSNGSGGSSQRYGLAAAADLLGKQGASSSWENVAAAATVAAATAGNSGKRSHVQFGTDDRVLVMVSLLNITNHEDDKDMFTIDPVNKYGFPVGYNFPVGGGNTEAERHGPFSFVIATVTNVHFDEDERYYTVRRYDTGTEQRADSGWMEPIKDLAGIESAMRAAHHTTRSAAEEVDHVHRHDGLFQQVGMVLSGCVSWPAYFVRTTLRTFYRDFRAGAKAIATSTMHGDKRYAYRVSCTSINVLVLCSLIYLFLEPISLAFLTSDYDFGVAVTEL